MAICAIAGFYGLASRPLACRYRLCSQPAFPADPASVHLYANDGAPRQRLNGKGQVMNIQAPLRLENTTRPLEGRVSLVTGSTSGIGLGIARALGAAGSAVVLNGFGKPEDIAEAQAKLVSDFGVKARFSPADMSKAAPIADMIEMTLDTFGRLDVLVNNAGIQNVAPIEQFPIEKWDAILAINLSSAFHTTRAALPSMRKNNFGRIINIASAHGLVASPFKAAYVAAKHGIVGLTKVIALETAEANITCNAICPGYVYTPLVEAQIDAQAKTHGIPRDQVIRDVLLAQQPNKRFATVEELGAFSVFLASDAAASITGTALPVDGGWTAH
jgi:3-hydroxybutyrate dehydrogenase